MFRTSGFLAIAFSVTAIGSAATPAAALPLQVFGGASSHIATQLPPTQTATGMQSSQEAIRVLGPQKMVDLPPKIPTAPSKTSVGTAQIPVSKLPVGSSTMKQPQIPVSELPPPPALKPHPVDDVCPLDPLKCPPKTPKQKDDDSDKGHGTVVILAPQVPVAVPVTVPVAVPVRLATTTNSGVATQVRPTVASPSMTSPSIASGCGTSGTVPALAAGIDELLPSAQLSNDDLAKVSELRQMIQDLATDGKLAAARNIEEVAMYYLGYQKIWLQCGLGTFAWTPVVHNDAVKTADQSK
ncbi:hypothetical protein [Bradyrhizobium acaciae]|uniref:hypothetical protein n=1 Tax=Bradyrhizobium acaciae TaxID=2683706 RepID=UPI001E616C51|nr:hypothetical protein [Bradyrhizobium acaciae]MCC8982143.1 hypothetical protein [Bradyrhizobium acaciae]